METVLRYLCLLLISARSWYRSAVTSSLSPPSGLAAASRLSALKVTSKWKQSERNTCSNAPTRPQPPPRSPLRLIICIPPSFPVFHGCAFGMEQRWKTINNFHVIGTLGSDAIDLLSCVEDGPLSLNCQMEIRRFSWRFWLFKFRFDENWSNAAVWKRSIVHALTWTMCFE